LNLWSGRAYRLQRGDRPATSSRCASVSRPGHPGTRRRWRRSGAAPGRVWPRAAL